MIKHWYERCIESSNEARFIYRDVVKKLRDIARAANKKPGKQNSVSVTMH